jgi:hypothetical protein
MIPVPTPYRALAAFVVKMAPRVVERREAETRDIPAVGREPAASGARGYYPLRPCSAGMLPDSTPKERETERTGRECAGQAFDVPSANPGSMGGDTPTATVRGSPPRSGRLFLDLVQGAPVGRGVKP